MKELLGLLLISFAITSFFMVPFIDFLYFLRRKYKKPIPKGYDDSATPVHNKLLAGKDEETPVGAGILLIVLVTILSVIYAYFYGLAQPESFYILIFVFLSFGMIGLMDDVRKILTAFSGKYVGIKGRYILLFQIILASAAAYMLYTMLGLDNVYISGLGNFIIGAWYMPLAAFVIVAFSNAYNISDGFDGLSTGLLAICLFALLALSATDLNLTMASFIGIWIGSLFAFLYFNVYPARVYLGDAGALSFGATLAVIGLLSGKILALGIIGGVYVLIVGSSAMQIFWKKAFGRKLFPLAPLHMYLRYIGWAEPKIVIRLWLVAAIFAIFGLWLALLSK
jgi:phospho-N-acetylmuramoyl-pentapeptide-transferase